MTAAGMQTGTVERLEVLRTPEIPADGLTPRARALLMESHRRTCRRLGRIAGKRGARRATAAALRAVLRW